VFFLQRRLYQAHRVVEFAALAVGVLETVWLLPHDKYVL
jgi:hypothetical protein